MRRMQQSSKGRKEGEKKDGEDGREKGKKKLLSQVKTRSQIKRKFYMYLSHVPYSFKVLAAMLAY